MQAYIPLNGSFTKNGNYVWGGALTLAWRQLVDKIILEPIKIKSNNKDALSITQNFNKSPFDFKMLNAASFYALAGFGNNTVRQINQQVHKKFPEKTTPKLQENLSDSDIVSFAYFFKNMKFLHPFSKADVQFNKKTVPGFQAKTTDHRNQVLVHKYQSDEDFIIQLQTTSKDDTIFLLRNGKQLKPEDVLEKVQNLKVAYETMGQKDIFKMPKIGLKHKRDVEELKGVYLANEKFKQYHFAQIYEIINLDIDQTGVKVENEGVIIMTRGLPIHMPKIRKFVLDKPFWIVMRQKQQHPYFMAFINNVDDK